MDLYSCLVNGKAVLLRANTNVALLWAALWRGAVSTGMAEYRYVDIDKQHGRADVSFSITLSWRRSRKTRSAALLA